MPGTKHGKHVSQVEGTNLGGCEVTNLQFKSPGRAYPSSTDLPVKDEQLVGGISLGSYIFTLVITADEGESFVGSIELVS